MHFLKMHAGRKAFMCKSHRAKYTALKCCVDSTSGSQNCCSLSVKLEFTDCLLQNQQENFHSPASHVAISQKPAQELKEIKHYHPVHILLKTLAWGKEY